MTAPRALLSLAALATALAGCNLAPHTAPPGDAAPAQWPTGAAYPPVAPGQAGLPWRSTFGDARLQQVIATALARNADLAVTLATVAEARAQYQVARAYQLPAIAGSADASLTRGLTQHGQNSQLFEAGVGASAFEIDLFGRVRNQSRQALEAYLATASGARAARLTLVANVATAWLTLAADRDLLAIAAQTQASAGRSLALQQSLFNAGLANGSDLASAQTVVETAASDLASQTTLVAQDRNALERLAGGPVADDLLPAGLAEVDAAIAVTPAGLSSDVLLRRPDVVEAEHQIRGSDAAIGAARAAFFPQISLTSAIGVAAPALASLFSGGALAFTGAGTGTLPLIGGPTQGNLELARAQNAAALAGYKVAVQNAFRDVADALARRGTIDAQRAAQDRLVGAAARATHLADVAWRAGTGGFLAVLIAERTEYAARQSRTRTLLADLANRVTLYSAIGDDESLAGAGH